MPIVNIVLCTRDGGGFLDAQLQSFLDQDHKNWRLWVSDDGSTDDTRDKIKAFARANPSREVRLLDGPRQGSAANFLSVLAHKELAGSWVSFADQDDVWMPRKLSRAVSGLRETSAAIYASRTVLTRPDLSITGPSPLHMRPYGFGNALVQNVLAGNTIVMPPATTDLIRDTLPATQVARVPFHDWWIYLVTSGVGLPVINDPEPSVFYRQHTRNLLGSGAGKRMARIRMLNDRTYAGWIDRNIAALREVMPLLSDENQRLLEGFRTWRETPIALRFGSPQSLGLYRQTGCGNMILRVLAQAGRI